MTTEKAKKPLDPLQQRAINAVLDLIMREDEHIHDNWGQSGRETADYIYKKVMDL